MNTSLSERIAEAAQTAALLRDAVRSAHSAAVTRDRVAELILLDLLLDVVKVTSKLEQLDAAVDAK